MVASSVKKLPVILLKLLMKVGFDPPTQQSYHSVKHVKRVLKINSIFLRMYPCMFFSLPGLLYVLFPPPPLSACPFACLNT
jgi:hypothetical protein